MSRHEGVSCDSCLKGNFRGKRYKCLICYDYDLCATCYEAGATTTRHTTDHPMQCILTRTDFDLYYGGEALAAENPQAFTCPYCGRMGYTETSLQEHVTAEHPEASTEVVCPICAALPGGDPNHVTDDFAAHLTLEHRAPRDFQDEPLGGIRHVRRIPHPSRGMGGGRTRRTTMHFQSAGSALSGLSPSSRDNTMDPIAELLSQLSSVRSRAAAAQSVSSQLQQLEMQLQSTSRQQLERLPRRQAESASKTMATPPQATTILDFSQPSLTGHIGNPNSQFLLARLGEGESSELEKQAVEMDCADRSMFVQELLLSTLAERLRLEENESVTVSSSSESDSDTQSISNEPASSEGSGGGSGANGGDSGGGGGGANLEMSPAGGASVNVSEACVLNAAAATPAPASLPVSNAAAVGRTSQAAQPRSQAKPTAHRNMVKPHRGEASKNTEKEPPPNNAHLARH
jgi:hypothetical protein